jgi:hypothetical protein
VQCACAALVVFAAEVAGRQAKALEVKVQGRSQRYFVYQLSICNFSFRIKVLNPQVTYWQYTGYIEGYVVY